MEKSGSLVTDSVCFDASCSFPSREGQMPMKLEKYSRSDRKCASIPMFWADGCTGAPTARRQDARTTVFPFTLVHDVRFVIFHDVVTEVQRLVRCPLNPHFTSFLIIYLTALAYMRYLI